MRAVNRRAALGYTALGYVGLALLAYVPVLRAAPGKVAADTKQYLYLDPARLLGRAITMWDPNIGMGTVTHQTVGYVFPMGPYYWAFDRLGVPDWVAQRLWLGTLMFGAGAGVLYLLRTFGLRGPGVVVAALAYMLSPYSLDYAARISVLLMPWAALPWMIALVRKALRDGGWRYPAAFALVVQVVGGVNATALVFAGIGPALWIVYSWLVAREVQWRRALEVTAKTGVLTLAASLWWIAGLSIQGQYGLNVLRYTETVEAVAKTSMPNEILRGLGYWFFYGQDRLGPWIESAENYTQRPIVILAGYALATLALLSAGFVRWRHRMFFVGLLFVGVVVAVGAHPYGSPTPLGSLFKAFANSSSAGLALRSTGRAVPLVVLCTAVLLGVGLNAVYDALRRGRRPRLAVASVGVVVVLVVVNFPALVDGTFYGENLQRPEEVPQYWRDAAAHLDARGDDTRVFELPGVDFSSYRWGNTVDPITPGLMDRPYVARELIPWGSPATANLLNAIDRRIQDQVFDPAGFAALARRMGIGDVVLRNDLQYERYDVISPRDVSREFAAVPGLGPSTSFGTPSYPVLFKAHEDERTLGAPAGEPPPAPVVVYPVEDPTPIVRGESTAQAVMVAGDGEGLIDVADIGVLDRAGIVQYSSSYTNPDELRRAIDDDTTLVVSDSNRRRARRWTSVRDNEGVTEQPGEEPIHEDPGDARLDVFPDATDAGYSTIDQGGVRWVTATSYGNIITYTPEDAAARAFDGDPATAWRAGGFGPALGQRIHLELDRPITADHVTLVQTLTRGRDRYITGVSVRFDGGDAIDARLDGSSRTAGGQLLTFDRRRFRTLDIEVTDLNTGKERLQSSSDAVGFAEIRVRDEDANHDVRVDEVVRMPTDLLDAVGDASLEHALVVVMNRNRVQPIPPRRDPEPALQREFSLPTGRTFALTGTARVSSEAGSDAIAAALGRPSGVHTDASAFLPGCVGCRADAAFDGDPETAWQTPFNRVRHQWIEAESPTPVTIDHLDLTVVADGRHSVPTRVLVDVDGATRELALPAIADQAAENATTTVPLTFAPVIGRRVRVTVADVREATTWDFYAGAPSLLPAGIAELGIPSLEAAPTGASTPGDCRDDLLRIDDRPVHLRVLGTTADAVAGNGLTVEPCDPDDATRTPPIALSAGAHVVRAEPGIDTGIQLDRLVLGSAAGGTPLSVADGRVTGLPDQPPPAPSVEILDEGRTRLRVRVDGADEPFWLVLGQSDSTGWKATANDATVGPRRLVDGYANGWLVQPGAGSFEMVIEWTPQRRVWTAVWLSLAAALGCIALIAWSARRRAVADDPDDPDDADETAVRLEWPLDATPAAVSSRTRVALPLALGLVAAIAAAPWVGVVVAIAVALGLLSRVGRLVIAAAPAGLLALSGLYIAWGQQRNKIPAIFEWPTVYPRARSLAWCAVLLALGAAAIDGAIDAARRRRDDPPLASPIDDGDHVSGRNVSTDTE